MLGEHLKQIYKHLSGIAVATVLRCTASVHGGKDPVSIGTIVVWTTNALCPLWLIQSMQVLFYTHTKGNCPCLTHSAQHTANCDGEEIGKQQNKQNMQTQTRNIHRAHYRTSLSGVWWKNNLRGMLRWCTTRWRAHSFFFLLCSSSTFCNMRYSQKFTIFEKERKKKKCNAKMCV